ncbi:MAG: molecular chaperone DnaJ [Nitrospirae bacterium]|nr:molecular chaperone DnaJ [Nitrospirota bacterium]
MAERDFYEILGVPRNASADDLKKAFRRMAMEHHPDKNQGNKQAEERFKEVNEAYEVLRDPERRAVYDQYGRAGLRGAAGGAAGVDFGGGLFEDIFEDFFGDIFGGRRARRGGSRREEKGADLELELIVTLEEAVRGGERETELSIYGPCDACGGNGIRPGTRPETCSTCRGRGRVQIQQGFFTIARTCPSCHGQGEVVREPCTACRGEGRVPRKKKVSIKIQPGVDTGTRIRYRGEGVMGRQGAQPGDLYVRIIVENHPLFQRVENDLVCDMPIDFPLAALGGKVQVPTLDGPQSMEIPSGTQTGDTLRVKGCGIPDLRSGRRGDLLIRIFVEVPDRLSREQKRLLEEFARVSQDSEAPRRRSFLEKARKFWKS